MIGSGSLGRVREQRPLSRRRSVIKPAGSDKTADDGSTYLTGGDMGDRWGEQCRGTDEEMELEERWRCGMEVVIRRMAAFFFRPITCMQLLHHHHRSVSGVQEIITLSTVLSFVFASRLIFCLRRPPQRFPNIGLSLSQPGGQSPATAPVQSAGRHVRRLSVSRPVEMLTVARPL